jgi:hypothetical protein
MCICGDGEMAWHAIPEDGWMNENEGGEGAVGREAGLLVFDHEGEGRLEGRKEGMCGWMDVRLCCHDIIRRKSWKALEGWKAGVLK